MKTDWPYPDRPMPPLAVTPQSWLCRFGLHRFRTYRETIGKEPPVEINGVTYDVVRQQQRCTRCPAERSVSNPY